MSLPELTSAIEKLPRADKLRLIQLLATDLAKEDGIQRQGADSEYPVWTPLNAFDAADTLPDMLRTDQADA